MRASDILRRTKRQVETVAPSETLAAVVKLFVDKKIRSLVVTDAERVVGIITVTDMLRRLDEHGGRALQETIDTVMTADFVSVGPDTLLDDIRRLFIEKQINHIPVLRDGKLAGLLTPADVLGRHLDHVLSLNKQLSDYIYGSGYH